MRVLYTYEKEMPTVTMIRASAMKRQEKGTEEVRFKHVLEVTRGDIEWCDMLNCIRPDDPYTVQLARRARKCGCYVVAYYDDDLYRLPSSLPHPIWRKNSIPKVLAQSDAVHSTSPYICEKYRKMTLGKDAMICDSAVESEEIKQIEAMQAIPETGEKVKLVYAANPGHAAFFNRFILPIMPQLCSSYGERISLTFMGVRPDLSDYEQQMEIHYIPGMPLDVYRQKIREGNYEIGLSPLTSDEFTKCKYFNKFIEYTMAGIVGIYSNTEPYTYVVKNGENGFLVGDDPQEWLECLRCVIDDAMLRNRCICAAQRLLLTEFSPQRQEEKLEQHQQKWKKEKTGERCAGLALPRLSYRLIRVLDKLYLLQFYLRQGGISAVLAKVRQ